MKNVSRAPRKSPKSFTLFSKFSTSLVNGDLPEKTHVLDFAISFYFARSSLQKFVSQKVTKIWFGYLLNLHISDKRINLLQKFIHQDKVKTY